MPDVPNPQQFITTAPVPPSSNDLMLAVRELESIANGPVSVVTDETRNALSRVVPFLAHLAPLMDILQTAFQSGRMPDMSALLGNMPST